VAVRRGQSGNQQTGQRRIKRHAQINCRIHAGFQDSFSLSDQGLQRIVRKSRTSVDNFVKRALDSGKSQAGRGFARFPRNFAYFFFFKIKYL
jgi:hypothetical protein